MHYNQFSPEVLAEIRRAHVSLDSRPLWERRQAEARSSYKAQALVELANRISLERRIQDMQIDMARLQVIEEEYDALRAKPLIVPLLDRAPEQLQLMAKMLETYLPSIGKGGALAGVRLEQDGPDNWSLLVRDCDIGVSAGRFEPEIGFEPGNAPRLRLFYLRAAHGGMATPEDEIDITIAYAKYASDLLVTLGEYLARDAARPILEGLGAGDQSLALALVD